MLDAEQTVSRDRTNNESPAARALSAGLSLPVHSFKKSIEHLNEPGELRVPWLTLFKL